MAAGCSGSGQEIIESRMTLMTLIRFIVLIRVYPRKLLVLPVGAVAGRGTRSDQCRLPGGR